MKIVFFLVFIFIVLYPLSIGESTSINLGDCFIDDGSKRETFKKSIRLAYKVWNSDIEEEDIHRLKDIVEEAVFPKGEILYMYKSRDIQLFYSLEEDDLFNNPKFKVEEFIKKDCSPEIIRNMKRINRTFQIESFQ